MVGVIHAVAKVKLDDTDVKLRIHLNYKQDKYYFTLMDEKTNKNTPLASGNSIPSFLKNEGLFLTIYAYNGAETIGQVTIKEIVVTESTKMMADSFDRDIKRINRKMINDLIHSHTMEKQNKSLLTVMINEEDITQESKSIVKIVKILQTEMEEKLYKKNYLSQTAVESDKYKTKYDSMLKELSNILDMQRKIQEKMKESEKLSEAFDQLKGLFDQIEVIEKFVGFFKE